MRIIKFITAHIIFVFLTIIILAVVIYGTWLFSLKTWRGGLIFFVIVGLPSLIWLGFKYYKWRHEFTFNSNMIKLQKALKSEIDARIQQALMVMDTTHKWYTDENEANRELVDCLKIQGFDVEYQPRLSNGSIADARIDNIIIEGKLSPHKADIDRLLGQLTEYTQIAEKVIIVIYGKLDEYAQNRIMFEVAKNYPDQVFLSYLDNPQRHRRN
jgi:hypothetical protein